MQSSVSLQLFDDHAFALRDRRELAGIAAASGRRVSFAAKPLEIGRPDKARRKILRPWVWIAASFALWGLMVGERAQLVRLIPALAPAYSAVGLGVNVWRMDIENVVSRLADEDGRQILVVEGEIRNLDHFPRAAPTVRLSVLDASGQEVYFWTAAPPKARLAAGEKAQFRARLATPPKEGRQVRVRFAGQPGSK